MERLLIRGGRKLQGTITASGAKNAALPIMAACILIKDEVRLDRVPDITDVHVMTEILQYLGAAIKKENDTLVINCSGIDKFKAPYELVKKIHASFDITGPLLARFKEAQVPFPGGCVIGTRAINFHIDGFAALGAQVGLEYGYLKTRTDKLVGTRFYVGRSSVGATKNIMMTACFASGVTILENAAREPEVSDLANFLCAMGARIRGIGTPILEIEGVESLHGGSYKIISDRIEGGTYLLAGAATGGDVTVRGLSPHFLEGFLDRLTSAGILVETGADFVRVVGNPEVSPVDLMTAPFPGFPTDLQAPIVALLAVAKGISIVQETIFDGRFNYVPELRRMGADIRVADRTAVIRGVPMLTGAPVESPDIRAGGGLVIAGLVADGYSEVGGLEFLHRGYEHFEEKLASLGAEIKKVKS
ncbi:MAG: UDP-N-acetylglucosamine 1-carboxyvinyltransferase [Armatimonadetes bacterium]|nr:UDP-N-acetylglucosamine 1-carboxyvinyltransferase [Armatimonadota bacterium]